VLAITNPPVQRAPRRERRTRETVASSETMAAEGHGLVDLGRTDPPTRGHGDGPGTTPDQRGIATG
jgi:hypothetical protein